MKGGKIKNLIKDLETDYEFLKPVITPIVQEQAGDENAPVMIPNLGQFTTYQKYTYEFSDEVQEKEKELKKLKANEVREGIATVTEENTILVFKANKE